MKKIVLLILIASLSIAAYTQQQKRTSYLTVWYEKVKTGRFIYYIMNAERGNFPVPEVFELVIFRSERDIDKQDVSFYHEQKDSAKTQFNYFGNPTAGLDYLAEKGWQLISVTNEISSGHKFVNEMGVFVPVTTISSRQLYYLKKEIE
jgi:hypothetical protein